MSQIDQLEVRGKDSVRSVNPFRNSGQQAEGSNDSPEEAFAPEPRSLSFPNGFSIDLDCAGGEFLGIGAVSFAGTSLRASKLPWNFYTESETEGCGVRFESFTLVDARQAGDEWVLTLRSRGKWMPRIQSADAMGEARIRSRRLSNPDAVFVWRIRAITERIYETEWQGLAVRIEYHCEDAPIHWLMESATWELGGEAEGCTLIQQDVSSMLLEQEVGPASAFSTTEKFFLDGWGGNFPMDMMPRAAGASICDFQSKGDTALCIFTEIPGHSRARLEKFADENVIHHLERCYFPLGTNVQGPERKLLVHKAPSPLRRHEARNLWLDCFTEVRRRILGHYGFELEIPLPSTGGHLWDLDVQERGRNWAEPMARDMDEYARLGFRQIFVHGVWDSITSDPEPPAPGNICHPYTFRFADCFGGAEGMKNLSNTAHANGLRLMQWFSFHLSRYAPVWKEHPDWILREANGDPWDGNYDSLWSGRMRSGYAVAFLKQIESVMDDTGIDGIFWDSYHNLGVVAIDWSAPDKAPQADEIFYMQAALQRKGFRQWVEATTIFGVSRVALFGFHDTKFRRRLWDEFVEGDHAFALLDTSPAFFIGQEERLLSPERLSPEKYFWLVAHRVVPGLSADPWELYGDRFPGGPCAGEYARTNHLYNAALPRMIRMRLQEGGTHVLWLDEGDKPAVVWVFRAGVRKPEGDWKDVESAQDAPDILKELSVYVAD